MIDFLGFHVSFPIQAIAFRVFGIDVYYYAICIVVGIVLAIILCYRSKEKFGITFDFLFESLILAILIGVIGARLYYVAFHWENYKIAPMKILNVRDGGQAIYGGLIAGGLAILYRCKKKKVSSLDFFDYLTPFVALAQSIGRWGNFFNKEAYGTETSNIFRMGMDTIEGYKEVHPAFLYESVATFIIFIFLRILQKNRKFKGQICYLYLLLYAGIRMMIESIRIDSLMLGDFRISQILSFAIFVVFGIMLLKKGGKYIYKQQYSLKCKKKSTKK